MAPSHASASRKKYREYVESALGSAAENPLEKLYGGIVLGGERFVRNVLQQLPTGQLEREGVSYRKSLRAGIRTEDVLLRVCTRHGCSPQDLCRREHRPGYGDLSDETADGCNQQGRWRNVWRVDLLGGRENMPALREEDAGR
jgi:hypothetical protein